MISSKFTGWHAKNCSLHNSGFFFTKEVISQREATEAKHWTFGYESIGQMFKADQEFVKCFHILGQFMTSERSPLAALMSSFESDAF